VSDAAADPAVAILVVMVNMPDPESAQRIATAIVEQRLAACANVMAPCRSVYRWRGEVETADETPVFFKTTRAGYPALEAAIRGLHPYELPEIVALPVAAGLPAYLAWIADETETLP
jgi:periplasmic divalent cation tolerance protein